jgi:ubiquinone/menaquinone biosynthesis C-methylase UbiE
VVATAWPWKEDIDKEKRAPHILVRMKGGLAHRGFRVKGAEKELRELGVSGGSRVLDFESGTGVYTIAAARIVGEKGIVHAVDLHPASLEIVEKKAKALGLGNVDAIYSDMETGIDASSVDFILLFGVLSGKKRVSGLLCEAHRVVKPAGLLLVKQPGMKDDKVNEMMLKDGFFSFAGRKGAVLTYRKINGSFREVS